MEFISEEHEKAYKKFMKMADISESDLERKAMFYLLASTFRTVKDIAKLYDFDNNQIITENFEDHNTYSTSENMIINLAFNLFNGYGDTDVRSNFMYFDGEFLFAGIEAIKIKFNPQYAMYIVGKYK